MNTKTPIRCGLVAMCCLAGALLTGASAMARPGTSPSGPGNSCRGAGMPPHCLDRGLPSEIRSQLALLRNATSAFHSFDVAQTAGWFVPLSPCVESPAGGMGYHFGNPDQLANDGALSLLRPEALLFVPMEDGSMRFGGVEYIIAADDWPHAEAPEFLGQQLDYLAHLDLWALHVWTGIDNPAGIFAAYNPNVSCEFAPEP
jgi:hypothetical protein